MTKLEHLMNDSDFCSALTHVNAIMTGKGHDYTQGGDRLANFDKNAKALGLPPRQILYVYLAKHLDAIQTYAKNGQVESEPIEGRIFDVIGYMLLLYKMIRRDAQPTAVTVAADHDHGNTE